ncbi:MAG: ferrous iron transport protein A [Myxococcales bacterium]|nr:MAG: ferrous iron transport protein A [Myxococcales bacterium]
MTLDTLKPGESAELVEILGCNGLRRRLLELGLTPGTHISIVRVAPMGDPIELKVRGYRLSLCRREAAQITCRAA